MELWIEFQGPNQTCRYRETEYPKATWIKLVKPFREILGYQVSDAINRINSLSKKRFGTNLELSIEYLIDWTEQVFKEEEMFDYCGF